MPPVTQPPEKRSLVFWGLTLSCLGLSIFILGRMLYSYYQAYFGRAMDVLSEHMGAEKYEQFLAEHLGLDMFALTIATFTTLALSMIYMIRKKYALGNIYLVGFLICMGVAIAVAFVKYDGGALPSATLSALVPVIIFFCIIAALFYYGTKYKHQAVLT